MASKKKEACPPLALWLVTFSDLVTLLLTFFVLLLTMSSMDKAVLTRVTLHTADLGVLEKRGSGRASAVDPLITPLLENPWEVMDKKQRLKDLLFPKDELPEEISKSELDQNLKILAKPDGVALVFTDKLLFAPGSTELSEDGKELIDLLVPVMTEHNAPINVAGYTDPGEGVADPFAVSGDRALSVLTFLVQAGVPNNRFSLSAYGGEVPVVDERGRVVEDAALNRRVEILLKTARPIGGYQ